MAVKWRWGPYLSERLGGWGTVREDYSPDGKCSFLVCFNSVSNRGPDTATVHVLPTLWYRNTWIWGCTHEGCTLKPSIVKTSDHQVTCKHEMLVRQWTSHNLDL
ncbi:unnamed protein product [Clavelina lepadiformis]|uniref:Uncharacterized protein n=1 Tax=Clavelina lepadiformis TaxID=159417 RepID=A0ABP0FSS1_CLALP